MDAILGTLGVVIVLVIGLGALVLWDGAYWLSAGSALEERLAHGEISQEQYRVIQRALAGAV